MLAIDSSEYLNMALNNDILDRLHAVILTERAAEIKEAVWALGNIAGQSSQAATILSQD